MLPSKYPKNKAAQHAIRFVENLTLVGDESGKPVKLLPFQKQIIATLFGNRRVKKAFLFLPRKSAKTFLAACIVLYWLLGRGLKGQQCLSIANDRNQAALLFDMAKQIVEADDTLASLTEVTPSTKRIAVPGSYNFYAALSTESSTKTGFNPSLVIVDEGQDIVDAQLIKNLTSGRTAREDYLTLYIGTAGTRKDTLFYSEYEYAKQWLAGIVQNDEYAAWVYEAPEESDWTAEATWKACLPAWGKFCRPEVVRSECKFAKGNPAEETKFRQFTLNQWQVFGGVSWLSDQDWMANSAAPLGDAIEYYAGFDKASVRDTTSLVLFGLNSQVLWDVIPFVWVCDEQVSQRITAEFDYSQWQRAGYLRVTPGSAQDEIMIADQIGEIIKQYPVKMFSIDTSGTSYISQRLQAYGFTPGDTLVGFSQAIKSMSEPIKEIEKLVRSKQLAHGGNPVLRWMANNVKLITDGKDNYGFSKKASKEKIDGMVALACAVGVAIPKIAEANYGQRPSVYESRGLLWF